MKTIAYYIILHFVIVGCKTEKKQTIHISRSNDTIEVNNTVKDTVVSKQINSKDLKGKLIGKTYSNIYEISEFKDYYSPGGHGVGSTFRGKEYSIKIVHIKEGITSFVIFNEAFVSESDVVYKILDVLDLTKKEYYTILKDNDKILYSGFGYKDGKNDQEIIAIAQYDENAEFLTKIYKAWRADRKTEKIIEIPVDGIKVENMDYGL